jgi:ectoine hydroxylase-related dioxygenase (phytanoyl-CoA dioxygenase family)
MSEKRNCSFSDDLQKELRILNCTSCVLMEQKWDANIVMSVFPSFMETDATRSQTHQDAENTLTSVYGET